MKATGVIVEYNPFHNGHLHHVQEARKETNADVIIAVMSGNFLQRGEPAFVDKWSRTEMALQEGVDIVFELPYTFATAHAPTFARGAIQLLDAAMCDSFCFGSEDGKIAPFQKSVQLIQKEYVNYDQMIKKEIQDGISYPKALNNAYRTTMQKAGAEQEAVDLTKPNNILGFQYIQAAMQLNSTMKTATIPRVGANYFDDAQKGNGIASATGIRKTFFESNNLNQIDEFTPFATKTALQKWKHTYNSFGSWEQFYPLLRYTILRDGPEQLANIADVTEGIENLFYRAATTEQSFQAFMNKVKSKRYTWTRLQRMLTHIYTGFTYKQRETQATPSYLRLLGMTTRGRQYLNQHKKRLKLPLISKVSAHTSEALKTDIHAANMYALGIGHGKSNPIIGTDYKTSPMIFP